MAGQPGEDGIVGLHGEGAAHHVAGLLAHVLLAPLGEDGGQFGAQPRDLVGIE
jgi:hypothetical protein